MKTYDDALRKEIAEILKNGITYSEQTQCVVIHGAIDELIKLIHKQIDISVDIFKAIEGKEI